MFYSVDDGHKYEIPNFINIVLNKWDDRRLMLLIKYFGEERLKLHIVKLKDVKVLKSFNKHIKYMLEKTQKVLELISNDDIFKNRYLENNIQYNIDDLYRKIQSVREFYEKLDDEGINTLVQDPKTYEWYRLKIENFIHEEVLTKVYQDN